MTTPALPSYATILLDGYSEQIVPALLRSDFEDGFTRQDSPIQKRRIERSVRIRLCSLEDLRDFKCWLRDELRNGALWWTFYDAVEGQTVRARFKGGDMRFSTSRQIFSGTPAVWIAECVIESWL